MYIYIIIIIKFLVQANLYIEINKAVIGNEREETIKKIVKWTRALSSGAFQILNTGNR